MPRWHTSPVPLTKRHFYHELQSHDYSLCKKFRCHEEGSQPPIVRREEGSQPPVCTAVDRATLRKSGIKVGLPHPAESPFRQPNLLHSATDSDSTDHSRWYNPGFSFWCVVSEDTKVWLQFSRFLAYATKFPSLHLPMQPSYLPVLRSLLKVSALGNLWKAYLPFHALASAALFLFLSWSTFRLAPVSPDLTESFCRAAVCHQLLSAPFGRPERSFLKSCQLFKALGRYPTFLLTCRLAPVPSHFSLSGAIWFLTSLPTFRVVFTTHF